MRINEERELKQSLVGFSLLKRFSPKTSFSPSLVRSAWNFSPGTEQVGGLAGAMTPPRSFIFFYTKNTVDQQILSIKSSVYFLINLIVPRNPSILASSLL
jgi:hypothetical protein